MNTPEHDVLYGDTVAAQTAASHALRIHSDVYGTLTPASILHAWSAVSRSVLLWEYLTHWYPSLTIEQRNLLFQACRNVQDEGK